MALWGVTLPNIYESSPDTAGRLWAANIEYRLTAKLADTGSWVLNVRCFDYDPPSSHNAGLWWTGDEEPPSRFALRRGKRRNLPIGSSRNPKRWPTGRWTGDWNHHSCKPSADGWLCQFGSGAICSPREIGGAEPLEPAASNISRGERALSVARKTTLTVSNNSSMKKALAEW
jgi:hypothetical protein